MVTITLLGTAEDVLLVQAKLATLPNLEITKISDPMSTADGSGRFRVHLTVLV